MLNTHYRSLARKIVWTLFAAQSFGSAGFLVAATVTTIVGAKLTGSERFATAPGAIYQLGISAAAFGWGYGMDRLGRRGGLTLGLGLGMLGALLATYSIVVESLGLFLVGLVLMGIANSALQLGRFAAAEVHTADERGRAISNVVIGGTVSAVFWFLFSNSIETFMEGFGLDPLAWPYIISAVMFAVATVILFTFLRPDPRDLGREIAGLQIEQHPLAATPSARSIAEIFSLPAARVAAAAMIFGQAVMVMLMVITALHMRNHQHSIGDIFKVISGHVIGMYAFSIVSGRLADRWGRGPVILVGAATLILACLTAPLSPDVLPLGVALFLLGLGWNFCYVGGSSLLADQLSPDERAKTQGFNDLLIGLVSALGSLGSGIVFSLVGYGVMGIVGAVAAVIPLALVLWWQVRQPAMAVAQ
ncbi:MAG: MFS transporter [Chloroflexi bacterium]|nr:MFS transporter [Chloroflexota bacterium]